ncbi:MAG: UDP-N-acetylglucosamine 2-epimerase, partial [Lutibacter sp.]|nr:UDP-N-acetylglucosamine 2-epimerase [Lutibacter sp.]
ILLCPTEVAIKNLQQEGFDSMPIKIVNSGDIMKDAVEYYSQFSQEKSTIIKDLDLKSNEFVLATIHRQENTDDLANLKSIFSGLEEIGKTKTVILPLHPRTKAILEKNKLQFNIQIIDPVGYYDMLELLKNCNLVVTDSGGLQKEAFFNKKHCIIAREETEWVELVINGFAEIVGSNSLKMQEAFSKYQNSTADFSKELYGNEVGETIYKQLLKLI